MASAYTCTACLEPLDVCQCGPAPLRKLRNALFFERQAVTGDRPAARRPSSNPLDAAVLNAGERPVPATHPDLDLKKHIPKSVLDAAVAKHGLVFVQGAWRAVIAGLPEGYVPLAYPKFQKNRRTGEERIVQTEAEHHTLFASDPDWELPPDDGLLAAFFKEL